MKTITLPDAVKLLAAIPHAMPIGFTANVDAMKRKTGCPFAEIRKLTRVRPFVGTNYQAAVNRQREREFNVADFVARTPRYKHLAGPLVQYDNGNICLAVQFNQNLRQTVSRTFIARNPGTPWLIVSAERVKPWTQVANPWHVNNAQDLDNAIFWRTYGVRNLISLALNGETFRIRSGFVTAETLVNLDLDRDFR